MTYSAQESHDEHIAIRVATEADADSLCRLAQLDSRSLSDGPHLIAVVGSEARAALSLEDGTVIANPFEQTSELIEVLGVRARQLNGRPRRWRWGLRRRARRLAPQPPGTLRPASHS